MLYIFNTPIITSYGTYKYKRVEVDEMISILRDRRWTSCVGHEGAAKLLTQLSGVEIPVNRIRSELNIGDRALVFQLLRRLPEGRTMIPMEELRFIPHQYGLLERIE